MPCPAWLPSAARHPPPDRRCSDTPQLVQCACRLPFVRGTATAVIQPVTLLPAPTCGKHAPPSRRLFLVVLHTVAIHAGRVHPLRNSDHKCMALMDTVVAASSGKASMVPKVSMYDVRKYELGRQFPPGHAIVEVCGRCGGIARADCVVLERHSTCLLSGVLEAPREDGGRRRGAGAPQTHHMNWFRCSRRPGGRFCFWSRTLPHALSRLPSPDACTSCRFQLSVLILERCVNCPFAARRT